MVKTKLILAAATALMLSVQLSAQDFSWTAVPMDGHLTGTSVPNPENVDKALGSVKGKIYYAPNGRKLKGSVAATAALMIAAQPDMAAVKEYLGNAPHTLVRRHPESEISNLVVDRIMAKTEEVTGRRVDVGLTNFGGLRCDIPEGDVLVEDVMSLLPFYNYLSYVSLKGKDLRAIFEQFTTTGIQVVGGVELVYRDNALESALIGGEPIDDEKTYGLATIDFLLDGGDHIYAAKNAQELILTEVLVRDSLIPYLRQLTAEGKPIEYKTDGRVKVL